MEKDWADMSLTERGAAILSREDGYLQFSKSPINAGWYVLVIGGTRIRLFPDMAALCEYVGERFG